MFLKVLLLCVALVLVTGNEGLIEFEPQEVTTNSAPAENNDPIDEHPPRPPLGFSPPFPPNLFNLFTQLFRPFRISTKTYGPSVIAIIGDKPYISMEVFSKFSPFKWLMQAFQGKIQNICGSIAPQNQEDNPTLMDSTPSIGQFLQKPTLMGVNGVPVKIFNIPVSSLGNFNSEKKN
ncbi:hypothetical protein ABEB36_007937 [Hypothenemus hampei]|uniref:Uncharacterized protein n=1 Tax=Hypothenemus hampei TaxID=57062 RepID=A0ABD1EY54_HYPHA